MIDKKEDLQVIAGARLAGTPAPEILDTDRAASFVSQVMGRKSTASGTVLKWGSLALSAAAVLLLVLWLSDSLPRPETGGSGTPALLHENQSIHSTTTAVDSLSSETDSLELNVLEIVK